MFEQWVPEKAATGYLVTIDPTDFLDFFRTSEAKTLVIIVIEFMPSH